MNAIHDNSAHFTRAGYFETPANATPSSSSSSSGCIWPRLATISVKASTRDIASSTGLPTNSSCSTLADAWLIEQPIPSYETSATPVVHDGHTHGHLVAAGRVDVVRLGVERLPQPTPARLLVVVQDDLLVELVELHQANTPRTLSSPRTSASISSVVVYR